MDQRNGTQDPMSTGYVPTQDEIRVFRECNNESFWSRSVPFSVVGMAVTRGLISKGVITGSSWYGIMPKIAFAGFCGYLAGKLSYMSTCREKFLKLENSPLAESLRRRTGLPSKSQSPMTELSDPDAQSPMFQPTESNSQSQMPSSSMDSYGYGAESSVQTERAVDGDLPEAQPMRKPNILYEDLRSQNRENYEVTLNQRAETPVRPTAGGQPERSVPQRAAKKNSYGDFLED